MTTGFSVQTDQLVERSSEFKGQASLLQSEIEKLESLSAELLDAGSSYEEVLPTMKKIKEKMDQMQKAIMLLGVTLEEISSEYDTSETQTSDISTLIATIGALIAAIIGHLMGPGGSGNPSGGEPSEPAPEQPSGDNDKPEQPSTPTTGNGMVTPIENGKEMTLPKPGDEIEVSRGTDKGTETRVVSKTNAWSREYSVEGANKKFPGALCTRRLNYAVDTYPCNKTDNDLLKFDLPGYSPCYAGAMVQGFGNIGDIVEVTLDDGSKFNFMILDTKSTSHTSAELGSTQVQNEYGHGYILDSGKVQMSVCEFITAGNCSENSAMNTPSGGFLKGRSVSTAKIVGHAGIDDNYKG